MPEVRPRTDPETGRPLWDPGCGLTQEQFREWEAAWLVAANWPDWNRPKETWGEHCIKYDAWLAALLKSGPVLVPTPVPVPPPPTPELRLMIPGVPGYEIGADSRKVYRQGTAAVLTENEQGKVRVLFDGERRYMSANQLRWCAWSCNKWEPGMRVLADAEGRMAEVSQKPARFANRQPLTTLCKTYFRGTPRAVGRALFGGETMRGVDAFYGEVCYTYVFWHRASRRWTIIGPDFDSKVVSLNR